MKKSSIVVTVVLLGLIPTIYAPILSRINSSSFLFGLSSDFWAGFSMSATLGIMLLLIGMLFTKPRKSP